MVAIAQDILAIIKIRIYKGLDYNLSKFRAYSTRPIYIGYKSTTYKRLKPKGGVKKPNSMFFAGGYAEYKDKSQSKGRKWDSQKRAKYDDKWFKGVITGVRIMTEDEKNN